MTSEGNTFDQTVEALVAVIRAHEARTSSASPTAAPSEADA